jgi:hypothetical protein
MAFSGRPLHSILQNDWSKNAEFIILTVFEALKLAHSKNMYHMDVRPGNIIVGVKEGKVSDWRSSVDGGKANPIELTNYEHEPCVFSSSWTAHKMLPLELTKYKLRTSITRQNFYPIRSSGGISVRHSSLQPLIKSTATL